MAIANSFTSNLVQFFLCFLFAGNVCAYEKVVVGIYDLESDKPLKTFKIDGNTKLKVMDTEWTCLGRKETSSVKQIKGETLSVLLRCEAQGNFFTSSVVCTKSEFESANGPIATSEFYIGNNKKTYKLALSCSMLSDDEIQAKIDQVKKQSK